jgi:hypothetical protein
VLAREERPGFDDSSARDPAESLRRWLARTETLVARSETTRVDWDKHLRPMLARQFELATGQRKSKDPKAFQATARMVFGDELWVWMDPDGVSRTGIAEPGPGRGVLDELLQRLTNMTTPASTTAAQCDAVLDEISGRWWAGERRLR